jgi:hypothetical protein
MLGPVKDQADCGCCWAFAATAVLEYQIKVTREVSVSLSEQELLDCNTDSMDCISGGWPTLAYGYIKNYGIGETENYTYLAYSNDCLNDRINRTTSITDHCECSYQICFLLRLVFHVNAFQWKLQVCLTIFSARFTLFSIHRRRGHAMGAD